MQVSETRDYAKGLSAMPTVNVLGHWLTLLQVPPWRRAIGGFISKARDFSTLKAIEGIPAIIGNCS